MSFRTSGDTKSFRMIVLVLVAGCGASPLTTTGLGRLDVTPVLQAACGEFLSDAEINTFISLVELDKLNGFSYQDAVFVILAECEPASLATKCNTCYVTITDQVYGL